MRRFFLCLPLLFFLASCGLNLDEPVVIYDSNEDLAEDTGSNDARPEVLASADGISDDAPSAEEPLAEGPPGEVPEVSASPDESFAASEPEESVSPFGDDPFETASPLPGVSEQPLTERPLTERSSAEQSSAEINGLGLDEFEQPLQGLEPEPEISGGPVEPVPFANIDPGTLSNDLKGWYYNRNDTHEPPGAQHDIDLSLYDAHYLGDTAQKKVYLTFDAGYEYGFTEKILDTLSEKRVKAAFFIPRTYIRDEPELSARIAADGHVAANHSARHISFPTLTDEEIIAELNDTAGFFAETTGYPMDAFFRPPAGEYSERTLALTKNEGYTTVFWSFAYVDWFVAEQPSPQETFDRVMGGLHNGAVILLHAVSEANTLSLPDIIDAIRAEGYEFGSLYELKE